ncbi:MAG: BatA domain-containing protein, partial [Gemmatimonas sp.]
ATCWCVARDELLSMTWQNPWAWAGALLLVLPVLVHLLSRAPANRRQFPSLRFVQASRLPPRRRTRVRDVPLLVVRLAILLAAITALAQPLRRSAQRVSQSAQLVRAIVVDTSASMQQPTAVGAMSALDSARKLARARADEAFRSVVLASDRPSDALPGAVAWLSRQQGMHELVVVSDFQRGTIDSASIDVVPPAYGVRLERIERAPLDSSFTLQSGGGIERRVALKRERTELEWRRMPASDSTRAPAQRATYALLGSENERTGAAAALAAAEARGEGTAVAEATGERAAPNIDSRFHTEIPDIAAVGAADSSRVVQLVYPRFANRPSLRARAAMPRKAWMAELALRLRTDALLQESARDARVVASPGDDVEASTAASLAHGDSSRIVLARNANGEGVAFASQAGDAATETLLVFLNADAGGLVSAALIAATSRALAADLSLWEHDPSVSSDAELRALSRSPSDSTNANANANASTNASAADRTRRLIDGDDSDARWLWALSLVLLGAEAWMRRSAGDNTEMIA